MLLLALLAVVLSSCGTSEPSYTKQSWMNAKEHSNTETLKPSFQPSIPNIHLTSKHQPETGAVHCSPLRSSLLTIGRTPSETLFSSLRGAMHHTRCYQIVDVHATNHQATKVHLTGKHGTWKKPFETVSKPLSSRNQNNSLHSLHAPRSITNASHIPKTSLFQKTNRQKTYVPQNQSSRKYP